MFVNESGFAHLLETADWAVFSVSSRSKVICWQDIGVVFNLEREGRGSLALRRRGHVWFQGWFLREEGEPRSQKEGFSCENPGINTKPNREDNWVSTLPHAVERVVGEALGLGQCFDGAQDLHVAVEQHARAGVIRKGSGDDFLTQPQLREL